MGKLRPCSACGKEISKDAVSCPQCGKPLKQKSTSGCLAIVLGIVGFGLIFGALTPQESKRHIGSQGVAPPIRSQVSSPPPTHTTWQTSNSVDAASGKVSKSVWVQSQNELNLSFPYEGAQRGKLTVRKHPRYGLDVIFSIEQGQLLCHLDECSITVRFDSQAPRKWKAVGPEDQSTELLFISSGEAFVRALKSAKTLVISPTIYRGGSPALKFNVAGFVPPE